MMMQGNERVNTHNLMPEFRNQSRGNTFVVKHYANVGVNTDN